MQSGGLRPGRGFSARSYRGREQRQVCAAPLSENLAGSLPFFSCLKKKVFRPDFPQRTCLLLPMAPVTLARKSALPACEARKALQKGKVSTPNPRVMHSNIFIISKTPAFEPVNPEDIYAGCDAASPDYVYHIESSAQKELIDHLVNSVLPKGMFIIDASYKFIVLQSGPARSISSRRPSTILSRQGSCSVKATPRRASRAN